MGEQVPADMDGGWKQVIEDYLEDFFRFFFPKVHDLIDFNQKCPFLDQELAAITAGAASGRREVDKLIEVSWRNGGDDLVLVHVEVQAQRKSDFAERMCVYNCRIWDKYRRPTMSLALLVDDDVRFRPDHYRRSIVDCRLEFSYSIVKLLDFKSEAELMADPSPFAVASLVQLRKLQAGRDVQRRFQFKVALVRELFHRNYARDDIVKLLRFIDYILTLPTELSDRFRAEVHSIEEELNMPYITSWERTALEKGREEGREKGREEGLEKGIRQGVVNSLCQTLEVRFGEVPESLLDRIRQCEDITLLQAFLKKALTAESLKALGSPTDTQ